MDAKKHAACMMDALNQAAIVWPGKTASAAPKPWPLWLRPLKLAVRPGDRGAGDALKRAIGWTRLDRLKAWIEHRDPSVPCAACATNQAKLNKRYPHPI